MSEVAIAAEQSFDEQVIKIRRYLHDERIAASRSYSLRIKADKALIELRADVEGSGWWGFSDDKFIGSRSRKDAEKIMRLARADDP
jgi:hypothetical protein